MQVVPLSYELLTSNQDDLVVRYKEYVPKMWITRKDYRPEYDLVTVGPPTKANTVATVYFSVIELGLCVDVFSRNYKKMVQQTKQFHYAIHPFAFAEPLTTTVWGHMPEANAWKGAIDEWLSALHYKPAAEPAAESAAEPAAEPQAAPAPPPSPALTPASSATASPTTKPATDSFCPKGAKHMYSEPTICGYSWHGPVRAASCINCGYYWTDH